MLGSISCAAVAIYYSLDLDKNVLDQLVEDATLLTMISGILSLVSILFLSCTHFMYEKVLFALDGELEDRFVTIIGSDTDAI